MTAERIYRRGLTLVEVLLAVVLLAALAGVSVSILRDSGAAQSTPDRTRAIAEAGAIMNKAFTDHGEALSGLEVGRTWHAPPPEAPGVATLSVVRKECDDCPVGMGRFTAAIGDTSLVRFHPVANPDEGSP